MGAYGTSRVNNPKRHNPLGFLLVNLYCSHQKSIATQYRRVLMKANPTNVGMFPSLISAGLLQENTDAMSSWVQWSIMSQRHHFCCSLLHLSYNLSISTLRCQYWTSSKKPHLAVIFLGLEFASFLFPIFIL